MIVRNRWIGRIAAFVLAAVSASGAMAQQAKMYGTVTDETGAGVPDVKVILEPVAAGARVEQIAKGKKGSFLFGIVRPGRYALKISAEGLALLSVKAEATGLNANQSKEQKWKLDGRVRADKPTEVQIDDGMEITCDLVVGKATAITTPAGETANASVDQAYALLRQQVRKGDCAGALPQLEKFTTDNPTHAESFYLKGFCSATLGKDDDALAALAKSYELDPAFVGTNTLMGKILVREKRLPEAEAAFKKELEATKVPPGVQLDDLLSLGAVQRDQSKTADAIATYEKAITVIPTRPEPYVELSTLYTKAGQPDKAAEVLARAKSVGADDPRAMLNVGISYFNSKDFAHAESVFKGVTENSTTAKPDLATAFGLLGKLQMRTGKNAEAIESFKKCLELDPAGRLAPETAEALKALQAPKKK